MGDCPPVAERPAVRAANIIKMAIPMKPGSSTFQIGDTTTMVVTETDLRAGYNAYMRDYMRKKRAKDKANKS